MEKNKNTLGLLLPTTGCGGGGTVFSGGSATGSISSVSKADNNNMGGGGCLFSSEVSSSHESDELELGLGLSLGGFNSSSSNNNNNNDDDNNNNNKSNNPGVGTGPWGQYARILTAKDFHSLVSNSGSYSSSNSVVTNKNHSINVNNTPAGTKRTAADSVSPPYGATSQVVGWPPIRAYRMNSLVNQAKISLNEEFSSIVKEQKGKNAVANKASNSRNKHNNDGKEKGLIKTSLFVKVNMDGIPIGRKVDLNAHGCYDTLAQTLEEMFFTRNTTISAGRSRMEEQSVMAEAVGPSKLLDGSSEYVLTYEDKEGDWMLVGDVPWRMFPNSVKRLRIMRTSEANGLAPKSQESSARQRT